MFIAVNRWKVFKSFALHFTTLSHKSKIVSKFKLIIENSVLFQIPHFT